MVDVTHMSKTGLRTGVQRVVKSIYQELCLIVPDDIDIEPVVLSCKNGLWHFRYFDLESNKESSEIVVPRSGDTFLGIDLNAMVVEPINAGLFKDWHNRGAKIVFTIHDILPITHPQWWPNGVKEGHEIWLKSIVSAADILLSVSQTTQNEVLQWASNNSIDLSHLTCEWAHLGADFDEQQWGKASEDVDTEFLDKVKGRPTFIMVGTLEPRKGHSQCLQAFELLWAMGIDVQLIFVGKEGWMVDALMERVRNHPERGSKFFWLEGISDAYLAKLYEASHCLIQASHGEGFGLPLIEAAQFDLPIIARDISVFKEIGGENVHYFSGDEPSQLAIEIKAWLELYENQTHITPKKMSWSTWRDTAKRIDSIIQS